MKTYAGYIVKKYRKLSFEMSGESKTEVERKLKAKYPKWDIVFVESHNSVYKGKFGKPKVKKYGK